VPHSIGELLRFLVATLPTNEMIRICPECGDFYADESLAYCLADGCLLISPVPGSPDWRKGTSVINDKTKKLRRLKLMRWSLISAATVLLSSTVLYASFTIEKTPPLVEKTPAVDTPRPVIEKTPVVKTTPVVIAYRITGKATNGTRPLSGVRIVLAGAKRASIVTGEDGTYAFVNLLPDRNYTITAVPMPRFNNAPLEFVRSSVSIEGLQRDMMFDFQAARPRYDQAPELPVKHDVAPSDPRPVKSPKPQRKSP
jgi:hypothetical protein